MRRVDCAARLAAVLIATSQAISAPEWKLVPVAGTWGVSLGGASFLALDGLVSKGRAETNAGKTTILVLRSDSLPAAMDMETLDEASCCGDTIVHAPFSLQGYSKQRPYPSYHDLMVFSSRAAIPWVRFATREGVAYVHPRSLRFGADSSSLTKNVVFGKPTVVRDPFLSLFVPLVAGSSIPIRSWIHRDEDDSIVLGADPIESGARPEWLVAWDSPDRSRHAITKTVIPGKGDLWTFANGGEVSRTILFEGAQSMEPRRIEVLQPEHGGIPTWIVEADEDYADGVRSRLWMIRPDTLIGRIVGDRNGEGATKDAWSLDVKRRRLVIHHSSGGKSEGIPLRRER
jgi:hypothetical protein